MATMSYAAFLRGRPSTSQLAADWDRLHNGGARFGGGFGAGFRGFRTNVPGWFPGGQPAVSPVVAAPAAPAAPVAAPAAPVPEAITFATDPRIESYLTQGRGVDIFDRSIDLLVSRLRQRLLDDAREARYIKTVRNEGYVFAAAVRRI